MKYFLYLSAIILVKVLFSADALTQDNDLAWDATEQYTNAQRKIVDTLILERKLFDLEEKVLFELAFLDSDEEGNLVAYDFGKEKIIYFPKENYQNFYEITEGRGRGPGEQGHVFDLKFDSKGRIWVADIDKSEIAVWNPTGKLVNSFKSGKKYVRPAKLAVCNNKIYTLSEQYIPEGLYHTFDLEGENQMIFKQVKHEDKYLQSNMRGGAYSDGRLECFEDDLIHVGSFKNYIRRYTDKGELIYSIKSISKDNPEPLLINKGNWTELNKDAVRLHRDIDVEGELLFVGHSGEKGLWMYILDVYNVADGKYLRSFKFKSPVEEFTVTGSRIFVTEFDWDEENQDLAIYKIPLLKKETHE